MLLRCWAPHAPPFSLCSVTLRQYNSPRLAGEVGFEYLKFLHRIVAHLCIFIIPRTVSIHTESLGRSPFNYNNIIMASRLKPGAISPFQRTVVIYLV